MAAVAAMLTPPVTYWHCVACGYADRTRVAGVHSRMHACPKAGGMTVPMAVGTGDRPVRGKLIMHEREDYVGNEDVQRDADGRVFMAARVVTDETEHLAVYAPTAYGEGFR
jgi:hypothetical protein